MVKNKKNGFTLIELIVVITILIILGTISFISFKGYSATARDAKRISDIQNIRRSLELFTIKTGKYPLPDNGFEILYDDELVWTQGTVGDKVFTNLSRNLNKKPLDPLTELEYTYSVINSQTQYEVLAIYESDIISQNNLFNKTLASNLNNPKITGNYNQVYVKTTNYYIPTPTIINAELNGIGGTLDDINIISQIITNGPNNIENGTNDAQIDGLDGLTLEAFSGELDQDIGEDDNGNKVGLAGAFIEAYSGSILENDGIYKTIVETTGTGDMIGLVDDLVLNRITYVSSGEGDDGGSGGTVYFASSTYGEGTGNECDTNDIVVGGYTIAACNVGTTVAGSGSSLSYGNYFQFGKTTNSRTTPSYGPPPPCNYDWSCPGLIDAGSALLWGVSDSESKTATYSNQPSEDQILMKGPCEDGYHVPTYIEWNSVITSLGGDYEEVRNNLLIPLAGARDRDDGAYFSQHIASYYCTSSSTHRDDHTDRSYLYIIYFNKTNNLLIEDYKILRAYGLSVRCFKN